MRNITSAILVGLFSLAPLVAFTAPAAAQSADYRCAELQAQARTAAANATDADQAQRARRFISVGQQLCEARAEGQAARQFRSALRILGVAEVRNADASQIAATPAATGGN
jgi:hypothetical protein